MKLQCTTFDREDDMRIFIISFAFSCTVGWNKRLSFREKSLFNYGTVVSQSIKRNLVKNYFIIYLQRVLIII